MNYIDRIFYFWTGSTCYNLIPDDHNINTKESQVSHIFTAIGHFHIRIRKRERGKEKADKENFIGIKAFSIQYQRPIAYKIEGCNNIKLDK